MKEKINLSYNQFLELEAKLEIKLGIIVDAEAVPKSTKLLKLSVEFGDKENSNVKTVVTNLGSIFTPKDFLFKQMPFITNLEPAKVMGILSEAMIVPATNENDNVYLLNILDSKGDYIPNGSTLL